MTLREIIKRHREEGESGASLILAIIMLTVLAGLVAGMSLVTVALAQSTIAVRDATYFDIATGTAIADAVSTLNSLEEGESPEDYSGQDNIVTGEVPGDSNVRWQWHLVPVDSWDQREWYDVVATGYRTSADDPTSARTVVARLRPFPTPGARKIGTSIFYRPTKESAFSWGFFGADGVAITEGTKVIAYNSSYEEEFFAASLGSNEDIDINETAEVRALTFMNAYEGHSAVERCTGHEICNDRYSIAENRFGLDLSAVPEWIAEACGTDPDNFMPALGSTITLSANEPNCFSDINLSGEVEIEYADAAPSAEHPIMIYATGDVRFDKGTRFNTKSGTTSAIGIRIFTSGNEVNVGLEGDNEDERDTEVRAMIAANNAVCTFGPGNFVGGALCREIKTTEPGSKLYWDFATTKLALTGPAHQRVYEVVSLTQDVTF